MAKRDSGDQEKYDYVRAFVDDGRLSWEYQVTGKRPGRMQHNEDVLGWTEPDIVTLTRRILDVPDDMDVEVSYL